MATQMMSRVSHIAADKPRTLQHEGVSKRLQTPMFVPPNEFRMKLLKRILSVDGSIDNKSLQKLQKSSTDRTLQANIVFQNGDVGTLISLDRYSDTMNDDDSDSSTQDQILPTLKPAETEKPDVSNIAGEKRERPLKLPPIMLPPIHTLTPRPLMIRDFSGPVDLPGPLTDNDWEELEDCRYLRPSRKQFKNTKPTERSFLK